MGAILSPKYERGKTYVLHQLETPATLCTIENTLVVPHYWCCTFHQFSPKDPGSAEEFRVPAGK